MKNQETRIEQAMPEDASVITQFQIAMAWETEKMHLDEATVLQGVRYIFNHPDTGFYIIARIKNSITVGSLLILKEWSDWRNAEVWWIHSVYIVPESRGRGIFTSMFNHVEKMALKKGARGLRLYVEKNNHAAQAVYSKLKMTKDHYDLYEKMF